MNIETKQNKYNFTFDNTGRIGIRSLRRIVVNRCASKNKTKIKPAMMAKSRIWAATGDAAATTIAKQARPCRPALLVTPRDSMGLASGIYYHEECLYRKKRNKISNVMHVCAVICASTRVNGKKTGMYLYKKI